MEVTHLLVACLLVVVGPGSAVAEAVTERTMVTEDQQRVRDECRNPDYKKYVKCLMRPKRHGHHAGHVDGPPETDPAHCLETCLKKCDHRLDTIHDCEKKCSYCTKTTRHRHQIITEYETECASGNCGPANDYGLRTTNITTNIGINNVINPFGGIGGGSVNISGNRTGGCCPPAGGGPCYPGSPPCYPGWPGWSIPSIPNIVPQISLVPQITYGVGIGAAGGCAYNQWLCIQQTGIQGAQFPSVQPDCSGCGHPVLRYRCDVNCYATYTNAASKTPCKSPECIGGST